MSNVLDNVVLDMMDTTKKPEDYKGGRTGCCTVGNAINPKKLIFPRAKLYSGVTATRLNVTVAGQNVKGWKKRN